MEEAAHSEAALLVIIRALLTLETGTIVLDVAITINHNALNVVMELRRLHVCWYVVRWTSVLFPVVIKECSLRSFIDTGAEDRI